MIITITGPRSVGKTTISKLLAKKLKLKHISSDEIGEKAKKNFGGLDKAIKSGKIDEFIKNGAYSLIRAEYEKNNFIFDLSGGSVTSTKFEKESEQVKKIAKEKSKIIGLLPSKNIEESINFLFEREKERIHFKDMDKEELFKKVKINYKKFPKIFGTLCDKIIYVKNKSKKEIIDEILS